jgi:hypothetical protein
MTIQPTLEQPHPAGSGTQRVYRFDNGYGASVVQFTFHGLSGSYGADAGLWELAVVRFTGEGATPANFELTYDTPITDDVIGHLDEGEVQALLVRIRDLPAVDGGASE